MSPALWIGPRSYPVAPVSLMIPVIDGVAALGLYVALFGLAAVVLAVREPRWFIAAFLAIIAAFCLADQTRWQPWVFQYSFLLAVLALYSGHSADGERRALNMARLIIAFTYVFSGLQKTNLNFVENDFPWIVQPIANIISIGGQFSSRLRHGGAVRTGRIRHRPFDAALSPRFADRRRRHAFVHPGDVRSGRTGLEQHCVAMDRGDGDIRHPAVFGPAGILLARDSVEQA